MKNKGIILLLVFALGIASVVFINKTGTHEEKKAVSGQGAPDFILPDVTGKIWKLSDFKGKVLLVTFWASWCDSCKEENPSLQKLIDSQKGNDKFAFVSVLYNDDPSKAGAYMKANGLSFPVLIDTLNLWQAYGITGVPETFIIDKNGLLKQKIVGAVDWESPEVKAFLSSLLAEK